MQTEFEATFININKTQMRRILKKAGAKLLKKEFLQRRYVFDLPQGHEIKGGWLRVRDEGDKITLSLKVVDGDKIHNQREVCLKVDSLEKGKEILETIGCPLKAYQETKRELWTLAGVEITIDTWPFLEPFVEIEGDSEKVVKKTAVKLGFDYQQALFCSIDTIYHLKYNLPERIFNTETPRIVFKMKNPFLKFKK